PWVSGSRAGPTGPSRVRVPVSLRTSSPAGGMSFVIDKLAVVNLRHGTGLGGGGGAGSRAIARVWEPPAAIAGAGIHCGGSPQAPSNHRPRAARGARCQHGEGEIQGYGEHGEHSSSDRRRSPHGRRTSGAMGLVLPRSRFLLRRLHRHAPFQVLAKGA